MENFGLSFSPDGKLLTFSEWNTDIQEASILLLSVKDSSARFLTSPPFGFQDRRPAFSPAGSKIAFVRSAGPSYVDEVYVISLAGGRLNQVTADKKRIFGSPTWDPSGSKIVFASNRAGLAGIWRVPASGGVPEPIPGAGPVAWYPSVSRSGSELAYEHVDEQQEPMALGIERPGSCAGPGFDLGFLS